MNRGSTIALLRAPLPPKACATGVAARDSRLGFWRKVALAARTKPMSKSPAELGRTGKKRLLTRYPNTKHHCSAKSEPSAPIFAHSSDTPHPPDFDVHGGVERAVEQPPGADDVVLATMLPRAGGQLGVRRLVARAAAKDSAPPALSSPRLRTLPSGLVGASVAAVTFGVAAVPAHPG